MTPQFQKHRVGSCWADGPDDGGLCGVVRVATDALALENQGIADPTVLQTRAMYQFGAGAGPGVASAPDSANIGQLTGLSAASLAANGLTTSSTVGDWRQTIINKLGSATANQSVLQQ